EFEREGAARTKARALRASAKGSGDDSPEPFGRSPRKKPRAREPGRRKGRWCCVPSLCSECGDSVKRGRSRLSSAAPSDFPLAEVQSAGARQVPRSKFNALIGCRSTTTR